jgi:hypothetical protein
MWQHVRRDIRFQWFIWFYDSHQDGKSPGLRATKFAVNNYGKHTVDKSGYYAGLARSNCGSTQMERLASPS